MLRINVTVVPHGLEDKVRDIAELLIWNDGTGMLHKGNYRYEASIGTKNIVRGEVKGHNRIDDVWTLINKVLENMKVSKQKE